MTIQVREAIAEADPAAWLSAIGQRLGDSDQALLARALGLAAERYEGRSNAFGEPLLSHCREVAGILATLRLDADTLAAALLSGLSPITVSPLEFTSSRSDTLMREK